LAFQHGRDTRVLVNDVHLSAFFNNVDMTFDVDAPETTTYTNQDRTYVPGGLTGASLSLSGFWDGATDAVDEEISTVLGNATERIATIGINLLAIGGVTYLSNSIYTNYSIGSPVDGVVAINADMQASGGIKRGVSLHNITAETVTGTGASVDGLAATTTGGVAHLHVTAASGTSPTLDVLVEDSADDMTFATIVTFTTATVRTSERIIDTGTVRQYIRATWTITGTGPSFTFHVSYART
jgi:hypothetical protein